jgi:hypothetical protein
MAALDQYAMLDLIAEGARIARPDGPEHVSTREFDRVTGQSERFADLPRARSLSRIFLQGWPDLVELSLQDEQSRARTLAIRTSVQEAGWFSHEQAEFALKLVCRRLGGLAAFTPGDYRRERAALTAEAGRRSQIVEMVLPNQDQIEALFGSWDGALVAVGLQARSEADREDGAVESVGGDASPAPNRPAPSIIDVLDRCYAAHGTEPTIGELVLFARANGIPFPRKERGKPWSEYVAEWKEARRADGLGVPEGPPAKRDRPDYGQDVGAAREGERRLREWDEDALVEWAMRFLSELRRNQRPTQRTYDDWVSRTDGAPGHSVMERHGGFAHIMSLARTRQRQAR